MKEAFELIKERLETEIESSDKYIREYDSSQVQIAWNKGMRKCLEIVSEVEAECGKNGCALCYLGSPCEYQNEDVRIPDELMGWITCSERLPEENKFYAVTIFDGEEYRTEPAYYARFGCLGQRNIKAQWWTDCASNADLIEEDDDKVIAWMPLPSPYKPITD